MSLVKLNKIEIEKKGGIEGARKGIEGTQKREEERKKI